MLVYGAFCIRPPDDEVVTADNGTGQMPGITIGQWLATLQQSRPHWWPVSLGSGAQGSRGGKGRTQDNPFAAETFDLTKQGAFVREKGMAAAEKMAARAGTTVGATR